MKGFYSKKRLEPVEKRRNQSSNKEQKDPCEVCGLYKKCKSPKMKYTGEGKKKILIIGEAQGKDEDENWEELGYDEPTQFIGKAGKLLRRKTKPHDIDIDIDCWKINSLTCFVNPKIIVYTSEGYKQIRNIKVGDLVLTHTGEFKKVLSRIHDLDLDYRKNEERLFVIKTKHASLTVTENHKFMLSNGKWKKAKTITTGDKLRILGEKCIICGNIYYKNPQVFDRAESTCSPACHNISVGRKNGPAISKYMKEQYKKGKINGSDRIEKAHKKIKELVKLGKWKPSDNITKESYFLGRLRSAKTKQNLNNISTRAISSIGFGEHQVAKYLISKKIDFYSQFAINKYSFDFMLPKYNLIIEIENPTSYYYNKKIKDKRFVRRERLAKNKGFDIVFIKSNTPVKELKRIIKNHSKSFYFTSTEIIDIKEFFPKRNKYLYCIEVEDNHSFITSGIINHNCRPPGNKKPTKKQLKCCKPNIDKVIEELKPEFIWLLGGSAVESFYMDRFSNLGITRWRRLCIPDKTSGAWVIPLFHPSYLLRNETDKNLETTFDRDLEWAVEQLKRKPPIFEDFESQVTLLYEAQDIIEFLKTVLKEKPLVAFDYETSAVKPYLSHVWVDRHKIWTVSINGTAFPYDYPQDSKYITWSKGAHRKIKKLLQRILVNPKIKKVAHNLKFEDMWSKEILKVNPVGWEACTMNNAHIIDDRPYFTGLKFQAYINYGIEGYDKETKPYLRNKPGTPFNRLDEMPLDKLLKYNALDSLLTLKLHHDQQKILSENGGKRKEAGIFFREGLIAFSNSQHQGIGADFNYYVKQEEILEKEIKKSETKILNGKEAKLFEKKTGEPLKIQADISTKDLRVLLFDIMKLKPIKLTAKAQVPAVDHETLTKIDTQFTKRIIKRRKLVKLKNTYCKRFIRDIIDDRIRPFFDLHTTRSYRSSSDFQQNPKRDKEAMKIVRTGIKPSPGNKLGFFDYGSQEVRIAACVTKDPVLIKYIYDPTTDMHRDEAMEIFMLNDKQVTKDIRFYAKNQFVFPEFYGSWYKACATTLAETCFELETNDNISVVEHLNSKGITCYKDFENHVKNIEKKFWDKYHVYQEWKDRTVFDYHKKGYVELITGFRRGGYLTNNQLLNTPIQGPAFHCLLWSYIQLDKYFKKMRTKLVGQIHDELLEDIYPPEEEEVVSTTIDIMNHRLREHWDWIIVPLEVEPEFTEIDGNWYDIK